MCKRCTECEHYTHYWVDNENYEFDEELQFPTHLCKHCNATGLECDKCEGTGCCLDLSQGEDGVMCDQCGGEGVTVEFAGDECY